MKSDENWDKQATNWCRVLSIRSEKGKGCHGCRTPSIGEVANTDLGLMNLAESFILAPKQVQTSAGLPPE